MGQIFVVGFNGLCQSVNDFIGHIFGQITSRNRFGKAPFIVFNGFVFDNHVINQSKQWGILLINPIDFRSGGMTNFLVSIQGQFGNFGIIISFAVNFIL